MGNMKENSGEGRKAGLTHFRPCRFQSNFSLPKHWRTVSISRSPNTSTSSSIYTSKPSSQTWGAMLVKGSVSSVVDIYVFLKILGLVTILIAVWKRGSGGASLGPRRSNNSFVSWAVLPPRAGFMHLLEQNSWPWRTFALAAFTNYRQNRWRKKTFSTWGSSTLPHQTVVLAAFAASGGGDCAKFNVVHPQKFTKHLKEIWCQSLGECNFANFCIRVAFQFTCPFIESPGCYVFEPFKKNYLQYHFNTW